MNHETKPCQHLNFGANVKVARITDSDDKDAPMQYGYAEITVGCADCQMPFHFYGVEGGLSPNKPMCSPDRLELRAPIREGIGETTTDMKFEVFRNDLTEAGGVQ